MPGLITNTSELYQWCWGTSATLLGWKTRMVSMLGQSFRASPVWKILVYTQWPRRICQFSLQWQATLGRTQRGQLVSTHLNAKLAQDISVEIRALFINHRTTLLGIGRVFGHAYVPYEKERQSPVEDIFQAAFICTAVTQAVWKQPRALGLKIFSARLPSTYRSFSQTSIPRSQSGWYFQSLLIRLHALHERGRGGFWEMMLKRNISS